MRSTELKKSGETMLQKRLRQRSVVCHMVMELIGHCQMDRQCANEIGQRVISGIEWMYTGKNSDHPNDDKWIMQQRFITAQLVAYLGANAAGKDDALEIGRLFLRGIEWAWGEDQRDLRLVC